MSNGKAFGVFVTATLSAVRILTQILTYWLVITPKWGTRVVLPVNPLYFQVKGSELDTFPCIENNQCCPELWYTGRVTIFM
jgi:hypothetical protein